MQYTYREADATQLDSRVASAVCIGLNAIRVVVQLFLVGETWLLLRL